jgi:hypothetical protein
MVETTIRKNAWKVIFWENGKKRSKWFEGDGIWSDKHPIIYNEPLRAAVQFTKKLKLEGTRAEIVSGRRAFIQTKDQLKPPGPGYLWCPYCIKWRHFKLLRIKKNGYITAGANRCPICFISEDNYFVRRYNGKTENLSMSEIRRRLGNR